MPEPYTLVAPCFFGTESTLAFEVRRLGAGNVQVTDGRVTFQGGAELIAAANLNLRTAERVLLLLATARTTTFDELFDAVYAIPWEELLPPDAAFPVKGSSLSSQLSSVPACQSIVKKAVVKRLMAGHHVSTLPETGALYKLRFALRKDRMEMYLDTSGDGLHKRGYRRNATLAPIKETLAAAIADLGRVRRDSIVQDPFCGSGTLVIEAAQKALNIAPGLRRRFAAESFGFNDNFLFRDLVVENSVYPTQNRNSVEIAWSGAGQSQVVATPMHMCMVAAAIANDGVMMEPRLLSLVESPTGKVRLRYSQKVYRTACSPEIAQIIDGYMKDVVKSGTGTRAQVDGLTIAGKTGSAEGSDNGVDVTHAWFVGYIDSDQYPYAISVLVENGGSGGSVAAPVASKVFEYLRDNLPS